jgi:hypothetical protein
VTRCRNCGHELEETTLGPGQDEDEDNDEEADVRAHGDLEPVEPAWAASGIRANRAAALQRDGEEEEGTRLCEKCGHESDNHQVCDACGADLTADDIPVPPGKGRCECGGKLGEGRKCQRCGTRRESAGEWFRRTWESRDPMAPLYLPARPAPGALRESAVRYFKNLYRGETRLRG